METSYRDIPYATAHKLQTLDLFLAGAPTSPLLMFIHGGAWISGDKAEFSVVGERFAAQGVCFAAINYRLSPDVKHPVHAQDAALAHAWLAEGPFRDRFECIFVMGHSAGAHNAAFLTTSELLQETEAPSGFIGLEGIYDIPSLDQTWPAYREWFLHKAFEISTWEAASPARRNPELKSPWLIIHSREDEMVDIGESERFAHHLQNFGVEARLELIERGRHDEVILGLADADSHAAKLILQFVQRATA